MRTSRRAARRRERIAARRVERWVEALRLGRPPRLALPTEEERRAAALALRLHTAATREERAPQRLRERLLALPAQSPAGRAAENTRLARRRFLPRALGGAAALVAAAATGLYAWRRLQPGRWVRVGAVAQFPPGSVRAVMAGRLYAFVIHGPDGMTALSGDCTDTGCPLQYAPDTRALRCPCHGAVFDLAGRLKPATYWRALPSLPPIPLRIADGAVQLWLDARAAGARGAPRAAGGRDGWSP